MAVAIAIWSKTVTAGEPIEFTPPADLRIANVALGADLADENGRTTLKLVYFGPAATEESDEDEEDDEEEEQNAEPIATVLCSLTPGKIEQAKIDLVLEANQTYVLDTVGKNTVYISGNYIDQAPSDLPPDDDEVLSDEDDEAAFRLEDVSSDVEVDPDEIMGDDDEDVPQLLQPPSPPKKKVAFAQPSAQDSKKRSREDAEDSQEPQLSKKERKKPKKMKAEGGNAVPAGQTVEGKPTKEAKKPEQQKPTKEKKSGEGQSQGEGKRKKKNKGDKAKL